MSLRINHDIINWTRECTGTIRMMLYRPSVAKSVIIDGEGVACKG